MARSLALLALTLLIAGCGWINAYFVGTDNSIPPAALQPLTNNIGVQTLWSRAVSSGAGKTYLNLEPAASAGRLFVAGHKGDVSALDAASGQLQWKTETKAEISAGVGVGTGLALVGTDDGEVIALRQNNGEEAWRVRVSSEVLAPPQAANGMVVARTIDGNLYGLDAASGAQRWVYSYTVPPLTLRGSSPPLLAQDVAIVGLDTGKMVVLSIANGTPVWEKTIAPPRGRTEIDRMVDIDATPRMAGSELYIAAYQGNITAIDLQNGNTLWTRDFSSHAGLDVDSRQVYVSDDKDTVWALDRRNGGALWQQSELSGRRLSAPVVIDDYVVVGDFEGYLHWLEKDSGKIVGRTRPDSKGIDASPLAADDILFVLDKGGELSALRAGGSG
ncbi:MAG: outer membrane protein assembly factor BamB [Gammaproteobacteria bacterium]